MAFSVNQRRREMGVRMALGAEDGSLVRLVLGRGAKQLGIGIGIGLLMGWAMGIPLQFVLFGVDPGDPVVYLMITLTLGLTGLLSCVLPARAATRADPVEAMRVH